MSFAIKDREGNVEEIVDDPIVISTDEECIGWLRYLADKYQPDGKDLRALHSALYFCEAKVDDNVIFAESEIMDFAALIRTCTDDAGLVRACLDHIMESIEYEGDMDDLPDEHITNMALLYAQQLPTARQGDDDDDSISDDELAGAWLDPDDESGLVDVKTAAEAK